MSLYKDVIREIGELLISPAKDYTTKHWQRHSCVRLEIRNEPGHEKTSYVICEQQRHRSACASAPLLFTAYIV